MTIRHGLPIKRFAVSIGAVAAIAIIVLGVTHALSRGSASVPAPISLSWQTGVLPSGAQASLFEPILANAADDGNTAYTCVMPINEQEAAPEIWVTHDRASHWARLSSLSITIPDIQGCWITTDALNPAVALAVVVSAPAFGGLRLDQATTYATADGGATWRQLSDPHSFETKWMEIGRASCRERV